MSGKVVHFEIPYDDGDRARGFYREAFGWNLQSWDEGEYTLVTTGPTGESGATEPGFINGGMMRREAPYSSPVMVIEVEDVDAALAAVERLGGSTVVRKEPVGEMGWAAYFRGPRGQPHGAVPDRLTRLGRRRGWASARISSRTARAAAQ